MKLLVVGSNPLVRRMVLSVVADLASDIRECASAAEAIAAKRLYRTRAEHLAQLHAFVKTRIR
jgi:hypothetical protein